MRHQVQSRRDDGRLWLTAILWSLALNVVVLAALAFAVVNSLHQRERRAAEAPPPPETRSVMIVPLVSEREAASKAAPKGFARTSADQEAPPPENPSLIGERNTRATSDAPAVADAAPLPSQQGMQARDREIETTESRYQHEDLAHQEEAAAPADPPRPVVLEEPQPPREAVESGSRSGTEEMVAADDEKASRERLAEGALPVDRPVKAEAVEQQSKESPEKAGETERKQKEEVVESTKPSPPSRTGDPGFRGFQRKTELRGSISRRGRSALDVEDSPLGRYNAAISRAIEKSWQLKVVQNRDFITPGVIRVRVVLDPGGKVRSVRTVEEFGIGTIQKGFTHSAIREADLPRMPPEVRKELGGEPIELLYNFIF